MSDGATDTRPSARFAWGVASDVGRVRRINQDRAVATGTVFAVADGMGGHRGGEVAAAIAAEILAVDRPLPAVDALLDLVRQANTEIVEQAGADPHLRGMGTTVCALAEIVDPVEGRHLGVANVGDSRLYLFTGGRLTQVTEDHSLVETLVRDGRLTREEAQHHPQRNILTRALGTDGKVLVDGWELAAVPGDRYLVCSDGLFNELGPDEMVELLGEDDPEVAARRLVEAACAAGGRDNVTAVVVDVLEAAAVGPTGVAATTAVDPDADDPVAARTLRTRRALPETVSFDDVAPRRLLVPPGLGTSPGDASADAAAGSPGEPGGPGGAGPDVGVDAAPGRPVGFLTWRVGLFVGAVLAVCGLAAAALVTYARDSWYVGVAGDEVVIYQGRPGGVLWFDPTVTEPVGLGVAELDDADRAEVTDGVVFDDLDAARTYAQLLVLRARDPGS
ncbi:MAG: serine/threonine-protein phosphatase [Actinomyces sp.]|nr:MAG: serine/threonine-protein phosphatase [Actinomyces sp.]